MAWLLPFACLDNQRHILIDVTANQVDMPLHVTQLRIVAFTVAQEANVSKSHRLQGRLKGLDHNGQQRFLALIDERVACE